MTGAHQNEQRERCVGLMGLKGWTSGSSMRSARCPGRAGANIDAVSGIFMFSKRRLFMLKLTAMTVTCILGACFLTPLPVLAQQHGGNWEAVFKNADKDIDGTLDKNEAKAMPRVSKHFDEIDADKDGTISMDEMKASMEHMRKAMHEKGKAAFKEADKDNDGTLDKEEAKAMPRVSK